MVTMAKSKNLYGPYESNPANPVLTNANTTDYCKYLFNSSAYASPLTYYLVQTVGHADLFQDSSKNWYGGSRSLGECARLIA